MRSLFVIAALLIALIAGGLAVVQRLVVWDDYRDELIARAAAMTGQSVAIEGRIDLDLLPRPTLTMAGASLLSQPEAADRLSLEVDRLDLQLSPLPLLRGQLEVTAIRLVRPILDVEPANADHLDFFRLAAAGTLLPMVGDRPSRVSVVDGRAIVRQHTLGVVQQLEQVNLDLSAEGAGGPITVDGTFVADKQPFQLAARAGRMTEDRSSTMRLELVAPGTSGVAPTTLTFGGLVGWQPEAPRLRGELAIDGGDVGAALTAIGAAIGQPAPPLPPWGDAPFHLGGPVAIEDGRLVLPEIDLQIDGTAARGRLSMTLTPQSEIELEVDAAALAIPAGMPASELGLSLAPLVALANTVRGNVVLSIDTLDYRGAPVRRLRADLTLAGDGQTVVEQARAVLPGQTDVSFTGRLAAAGDEPGLHGALTAVTEDLRAGLAWLDLPVTGIADGRLRSMSLTSELSLTPGVVRLSDAELRVDASRLSGTVAVKLAARPQLAAVFTLDRLDVDAYWPGEAPGELLARVAAPLQRLDAAIEADAGRLTWRGLRLIDLRFDGRSVGGRVTIDQLTVGDLAEARAQLAGEVDTLAGTFDLSAELSGVHPARLLRRLGFEPPRLLGRLAPLRVAGSARGTAETCAVDLEITGGDGGQIGLRGAVGWAGARPTYQLEVEAEHADYPALLRDLGMPAGEPGGPPAPLSISGQVHEDPSGAASVTGTARLGPTSFTGRVGWQRDALRPNVAAEISVGEPTAPVLGGLLDLIGLRLELPTPGGGFKGGWSTRPLALGLLDRLDGQLQLSSKGGLAGPGIELAARLEQGKLLVDRLAAQLWDGRIEAELWYDVRRPLPYLAASLNLRAIDPAVPAAWLGLPGVIRGPADLSLEATAAGNTVRELVGSLIGTIDVGVQGDTAAGPEAPPERAPTPAEDPGLAGVTGSFILDRGIATAQAVTLELDDRRARLDGAIDLFLWAADLTVQPEPEGPPLRIVGPLDRPQLRQGALEPPAEERSAPSP